MRVWKAVLVMALGACGASSHDGGHEVTVHTGTDVVYAAAVLIDGEWTPLERATATTITVDGPFAIASVCYDPVLDTEGPTVVADLLAPTDGDEYWLPCQPLEDPVSFSFDFWDAGGVSGFIGNRIANASQPGEWIERGVYDVLAVERMGESRYRLWRDVDVTQDSTSVEVSFEGAPAMEARPVLIDGAAIDPATVSAVTTIYLGNTRAWMLLGPFGRFLPANELQPGDRQEVSIYTSAPRNVGTVVEVGDGPIDGHFPPEIERATASLDGSVPSVTWVHAQEPESALVFADGPGAAILTTAHAGWLAEANTPGALTGIDVTEMPGWDSAWTQPDAVTSFGLRFLRDDGGYDSASWEFGAQ